MTANRRFLLFSLTMIGSYVLSFQVYLALPLQAEFLAGEHAQVLVSALFVVSGVVAVAGQLRITGWFKARWGTGRSLAVGMAILAGNLATGAVVGAARATGAEWAVWAGLGLIGAVAAIALHRLDRSQPGEQTLRGEQQSQPAAGTNQQFPRTTQPEETTTRRRHGDFDRQGREPTHPTRR